MIAGYLAATAEDPLVDPRVAGLVKQGWSAQDEPPCEGLRPGTFYDVGGEEEGGELYVTLGGQVWSPLYSWPPEPRACREISQPSDIQEIK